MEEYNWKGEKVTVTCPECGSENVEPVHPFDYVKQCEDCGEQFSTGVHNQKGLIMDQGDLFEKAMRRPLTYKHMTARQQWEADDCLGILDWDGSCPHQKGTLCSDCRDKYLNRYK